jgi:hypothetical protein
MQSASVPYVKSPDGIRGIAVLMVVLIHSRYCPFGWVGVQVFCFLGLLDNWDSPFPNFSTAGGLPAALLLAAQPADLCLRVRMRACAGNHPVGC